MPAAKNKDDLVAITTQEWGKLSALIERIPASLAEKKFEDDTSIKDVVFHRAHWIDLFLGWYADGMAGRPVHIPAKGYKWSELKEYNALLRQENAAQNWADAKAEIHAAHARLMMFYKTASNDDLYAAPMIGGGKNKWTPGRFSEAAGASHYRSAAKWLRKCIRESDPRA